MFQFSLLRTLLFITMTVVMSAGVCFAKPSPIVKKDWAFPQQIGYSDVASLVKFPKTTDAVIIDSRPYEGRYIHGHIPTAISLPDSAFDKKASEVLPADKNTPLIFYCQGVECVLSHQSAFKAQKLGYTKVSVYTGGLPDWLENGGSAAIGMEHLKQLMDQGEPYLLIDSRPTNEFLDGSIPSSINIPHTKFDERQGMLPHDKKTLLIFTCRGYHCGLSHNAAAKAKALGYTNLLIAGGGYPAWKNLYGAGSAVVKSSTADEGQFSVIEFEKSLKSGTPPFVIVDVRKAEDFKTGTLPGAINIPVDDLEAKLNTLPTDKPVVFICTSGSRAGEAYFMAKDKLPTATNFYYLEATIKFDKNTYSISPNK